MKKPKDYDTWHLRGLDWSRAHHSGNETHGASMRAYIAYENWRAERSQRQTVMLSWIAIGIAGMSAAFTGLGLLFPHASP